MATFRCGTCGTAFRIPSRKWKRRARGHVKTMWCWNCKTVRVHTMIGRKG